MTINPEDVQGVAALAGLRLTEVEAEALGRDLKDVLRYVEILSSIPTGETRVGDESESSAPERAPGRRQPDGMIAPPSSYGPDVRDGFFAVPSPPSLGTEGEPSSRI